MARAGRVRPGRLARGTASEIAKLDDPGHQRERAALALAGTLTRDQVADVVRQVTAPESPPATADAPSTRRAFPTSGGRVTIELDGDAGLYDFVNAVTEVAKTLRAEIQTRSQAGGRF